MKAKKGFLPGLLMVETVGKAITRLKPKVRYILPPVEKKSLFPSRRLASKVRQHRAHSAVRKNPDVITFL